MSTEDVTVLFLAESYIIFGNFSLHVLKIGPECYISTYLVDSSVL